MLIVAVTLGALAALLTWLQYDATRGRLADQRRRDTQEAERQQFLAERGAPELDAFDAMRDRRSQLRSIGEAIAMTEPGSAEDVRLLAALDQAAPDRSELESILRRVKSRTHTRDTSEIERRIVDRVTA